MNFQPQNSGLDIVGEGSLKVDRIVSTSRVHFTFPSGPDLEDESKSSPPLRSRTSSGSVIIIPAEDVGSMKKSRSVRLSVPSGQPCETEANDSTQELTSSDQGGSVHPGNESKPNQSALLQKYNFKERSVSYIHLGGILCHQAELPRLPVPQLKDSCAYYLELTKLLLGNEPQKIEKTEKAVADFLEGPGPKLQALLEEYAETVESYVEEFWSDAYLLPDCPLPVNINPYFLMEEDPTPDRTNQIGRASSLVYSMARFIGEIKHNSLRPDVLRTTPLCMAQYYNLFGVTRVPSKDRDDLISFELASSHMIVMSRGQFYFFDILDEKGDPILSEYGIELTLQAIVDDSAKLSPEERAESSLGTLTTQSRKIWAKFREDLVEGDSHNQQMLDVIDSSLFVLCLDDVKPTSAQQEAAFLLHGSYKLSGTNGDTQVGTLANRWYDKLCLIVFENGSAGFNFEHSGVDGHTVLRMASDVFADTIVRFAQSITRTIYGTNYVQSVFSSPDLDQKKLSTTCQIRKIEWNLSEHLKRRIYYAETSASDSVVQVDHKLLEFKSYGKDFITSHSISPDAFVQLSILIAYFRLFGTIPNVYESVQTKHFLKGRTEAGRPITKEALDFLTAFCTESSTHTQEEKIEKLRLAAVAHTKMIKRCSQGHGFDRHLFALTKIKEKFCPEDPTPDIFLDESWKLVNTNTISTSNCGNPSLRQFGFGPVCSEGFGVGYVIKDDRLHYAVSSKHRQTQRYLVTIESYLNEIHEMLLTKTTIVITKVCQPRSDEVVKTAEGYSMWEST